MGWQSFWLTLAACTDQICAPASLGSPCHASPIASSHTLNDKHHDPCTQQTSTMRAASVQEPSEGQRRRGVPRRVVLTASAILERRTATYEVAERRPLAAIAALVRFADEPQWLAIEWVDGTPPAMFITPARDALLSATLDTAQVLCQL